MSDMNNDIRRGCLENGEPLEARYGVGWWSEFPEQEQEPDWDGGECPQCHEMAWYYGGSFDHCEQCGAKATDMPQDSGV